MLAAPAADYLRTEGSRDPLVALFEMLEDLRVRSATARHFPGAVADLQQLLGAYHVPGADVPPSVLEALRQYCLGGSRSRVMAALAGSDQQLLLRAISVADEVALAEATPSDSYRVARHVAAVLGYAGSASVAPDDDLSTDPEAEASDPLLDEGTTGVSLDGGDPSDFVDGADVGGGQLLSDLGDSTTAASESDETDRPTGGLHLPHRSAPIDKTQSKSYLYDEWDYRTGTHRRAWCRVIEERLTGEDVGFIEDVRIRYQTLRAQIRNRLLRMPQQDLRRVYRRHDGEELDLDATIEALADRRSGAPVDDRLRIRRDRAQRDVATAFLVDLSASTSSPAVPPEPEPLPDDFDPNEDPLSYGPIWGDPPKIEPVRRVIDVAKDAVGLMGDALDQLGDRYAIYGFSGTGRDGVEFKIGKDFADRVTPTVWASVASMKPLRYTRMGPAVRHAAAKLAKESARTKLLVVLSDGYPQDTDYGYDRHDREYGLQDTARAIADGAAEGIETFCMTIDPAGHDYLREMLPDNRYLVIDDVESLPEELARLYFLTLRR